MKMLGPKRMEAMKMLEAAERKNKVHELKNKHGKTVKAQMMQKMMEKRNFPQKGNL